MENDLQNLVVKRLRELDLGPVEAATRAGIERTYIRDIVEGKKRSIRSDKIAGLARALEMDPAALGGSPATNSPRMRMVRVHGHLQAGAWAETSELPYDEQYDMPVTADEQFASFKLHAGEIRGTSMNRKWPEGTVVIYTDAIETGEDIIPGKRYVVERERADGMREATVKELRQDGAGRLWLWPDSDDPLFQAPIPIDGGEDDTVRIVGRVRYAVTRE